MIIKAFVQARMSSKRFPGKILAPFKGKPLIQNVLEKITTVFSTEDVIVLTSTEISDDPLAAFLFSKEKNVFRGSLTNVAKRFREALEVYPCDWFVRICADSPLLDPNLIKTMMNLSLTDADIVTNVFPRSFPKGFSVEMVRVSVFMSLNLDKFDKEDEEHVTSFFYKNSNIFKIKNLDNIHGDKSHNNFCVDTIEDYHRLNLGYDVEVT